MKDLRWRLAFAPRPRIPVPERAVEPPTWNDAFNGRDLMPPPAGAIDYVIGALDARFRSANAIPVDRTHITRGEYFLLRTLAKKPEGGMIPREEIEFTLAVAQKGVRCEAPAKVMEELCRVYLVYLDAPEGEVARAYLDGVKGYFLRGSLVVDAAMIGKRVRLVEVRDVGG